MKSQSPTRGGVVAVLHLIAILEVVGAFFGGALANLGLGAEVVVVLSAVVFAAILFAAAAVVQELRNIEFNTRKSEAVVAPATAPAQDASAQLTAYNTRNNIA